MTKCLLSLPADRDGEVEEGQHLGTLVLDEEVADDSGSDGGVTRLPDADHGAEQQEPVVVLSTDVIIHSSEVTVK